MLRQNIYNDDGTRRKADISPHNLPRPRNLLVDKRRLSDMERRLRYKEELYIREHERRNGTRRVSPSRGVRTGDAHAPTDDEEEMRQVCPYCRSEWLWQNSDHEQTQRWQLSG